VVAAVLTTAVALRLLAGPIDLDFLRTMLGQEFETPAGKMRVHADRVFVEWSALSQPMRLVLSGLRVTNDINQVVATAPSVALSFDPRSVIRGRLLPTAIVVDQPTLDADIAREGGMLRQVLAKTDANSDGGEVVGLLIDQLLAEPNHTSLLGQLDTVLVERAKVTLRDVPSGVLWVAPSVQARLKRDASGVIISASARFLSPTTPIDVALSGIYSRDRSRISIEANIDGLKPSMLAGLSTDATVLRGIDIALSGRIRIDTSGTGEIRTVAIDVTGGDGRLTLPGILPVSHKVRSVAAHATIDAASHTAKIERVDVDVGAAKVHISGTGARTEQGQVFTGRAEVKGIPVDNMADYWPIDFAPGGRAWAMANLNSGTLDIAAEFGLSAPGDDISQLKVDRNVAFLDYRGMTVHYMPHMPELQQVSGKARYEGGTLHFDVAGGTAVNLAVTGATIDLTGLDGPPPHQAAIHMPIKGTAPAVIALLARPKLGLPRDVLYDPKRLGGDVAVEVTLVFPLLNALTVADIDIKAEAALSGFSLKNAIGSVDLTEAVGRVIYANSELSVNGVGKFDGNAVEISWRELFQPKAPYHQRYELKGTIPSALIAKAGFASPEPFITGPINVTSLRYQVAANNSSELHARFDLKGAKAAFAPLEWTKEAGSDGLLIFAMKLAAGGKPATAEFEAKGGGLATKGQVQFGADSTVQQVTFSQFALGRTDVAIDWKPGPGRVDISLKGRSLELAKVRQAIKGRDDFAKGNPGAAAATAHESSRVSAQIDQVLTKRGSLGALNGRLEMAGERLTSAEVSMTAGKGATFRVQPASQGRSVAFYVSDFGLILREAGWLDGLIGGYLDFRGRFNDAIAGSPLDGTLKLGPYRMQKVTPRADVDSLNSTIDGLNRAGDAQQQFDGLDANIAKVGDRIEVKNGRTSGKSIGLTTAGTLDLANDTARLRGVVVPGFALNNLLSNVPLLGPLLTGGKNAGLFAITYKLEGPFDDLKSDINMMSALTPGALREIFTAGPTDGPLAAPGPAEQRTP
jgi:flagellin-like hook-associated protein FlgL